MKLIPAGRRAWRRMVLRLSLVLVLLLGIPAAFLAYCVSMPGSSFAGPAAALTPGQKQLAARLRADVQQLAGTIGVRHARRPQALEAAARHIRASLVAAGYAVSEQAFSVGTRVANLEAVLKGRSRPDERVIIGAHYDTAALTPGADDNASGVAVLLELARQLRGKTFARSIHFVAFTNEEPPYFRTEQMGSFHYAARAARAGWKIEAMLCLESVGYYSERRGSQHYPPPLSSLYPDRGNFITFVGNLASRGLTRRVVRRFRRRTPLPSEGIAAPSWVNGVDFSDHLNFWKHGFSALMVTDTALFRNRAYHKLSDTPERLDYARMTRLTEGLVEVIAELAGSPASL